MSGHRLAAVLALALGALWAAGCRHAFPVAPLPVDWMDAAGRPPSLQALYRMDCCGHHNLITTVRSGDGALSLTIVVPPGGVALEYWSGPDGAAVTENRGRCRHPMPPGVLPLPSGRALPIPPTLLAVLLAGRVPEEAVPLSERPGWVSWVDRGVWLRARIVGPPVRILEAEVGRWGEETPVAVLTVSEHQGRLPSRLVVVAERERIDLQLQSWRTAAPPTPPAWLSAPECVEQQ